MAVWKSVSLFSGIDTTKIKSSQDDYQFAFVDGRDNNIAKRVVIDQDGVIVPTSIGIPKPLQAPTHTGFILNNDNDEGTGIKKGKILLICYTYKNEEGDESNPSPVMVIDTMQFMSKGYWTLDGNIYQEPVEGGTYTYDLELSGSIEAVTLTIPITETLVREVNVYVAEADYPESIIPPSAYRYVTSRRVPLGSTSISVTVSSVPSNITASQENDMAPKGDDITLVDGIAFIANSVGNLGLPAVPVKVWKIAITNNNKFNYINRFHRLDLHDEAGAKPDGTTNFFDNLDWDTEDMSLFRLMDYDMTTPLEVYHYPLDSTVKLHQAQSQGDGEYASLTVGTAGSLSSFILTARTMGTGGNDITLTMVKLPGTLNVFCSSSVTSYLILQASSGVTAGTVTIVKPNSYNATLDIAVDGSNNVTITLATANDSPAFTVTTTGANIKTLLDTAIGSGGILENVYSSVDDTYLVGAELASAQAIEYMENVESISVASSDITIGVAYGQNITSIAASICALINSYPAASALVEAVIGAKPGNGLVSLLSETHLSGGSGTTIVSGNEVLSRLLAFVRIPIVSAYSDTFIYLVKFETVPTGLAGAFVPLVLDTAATGEMLLSDFYEDVVYNNPVRNEDCVLCGNDKVPDTLNVSDGVRAAYEVSNRANSRWNVSEGASGLSYILDGTYPNIRIYDELANADSLTDSNPAYPCKRASNGSPHFGYEADGIMMSNAGMFCVHSVLPYATNTTQKFFTLTGTAFGDASEADGYIRVERDDTTAGTARIKISMFFHWEGLNNDFTPDPAYLDLPFTTNAGRCVFFCLTWEQVLNTGTNQGSQLDVVLYAVYDGAVVQKKMPVQGARINTLGNLYVNVNTGTSTAVAYPAYPYLSLGDKIEDTWAVLALQRFMPLYPTEGIGAYNEFSVNDAETPGLAWVNTNVIYETLSLDEDNRPGRIQWGSYGAMPNMNEASINEEILRIASLKSAMPTDEHNTILILTANNISRMALLGANAESCVIIPELRNVGIKYAEAFCYTPTGVAWLSQNGVIILDGNGYKNVSKGRINTSAVTVLRYDHVNNWIWARGTSTYVYQIDEDVWWTFAWSAYPDDFLGSIDDAEGWVSYTNKIMYERGSAVNTGSYVTRIKTKAFALNKKLGRFKLITNLVAGTYKVLARMYSTLITGVSTTTAQYTGTNNKLTAIPGTSGDYAQLELTEVNDVAGVEIEYISGR